MAKKNYSLSFRNAHIDVDNDIITEVTKDNALEYKLSDILKSLEGKELNITFKEVRDLLPKQGE